MSMLKSALAFIPMLALAAPAHAQPVNNVARPLPINLMMDRVSSEAPVRVQVSYQLQVPATAMLSAEEQAQAVGASHELIYKLAAHECEHLQVFASGACRLVSLNVGNTSVGYGFQAGAGQITGNAVFELAPHVAAPGGTPPDTQAPNNSEPGKGNAKPAP